MAFQRRNQCNGDMKKQTSTPPKKDQPPKPVPVITIHNHNFLGWLMSSFIVCACMFVLGVLVGRNTAPVQFDVDKIEEKLSNLKVASILKEKETKQEIAAAEDPEPVMDEHHDIIDALKEKGKQPEIYEQYVPPVLVPKYAKTLPSKNQIKPQDKKTAAPEPEKQTAVSEPENRPETAAAQKSVAQAEEPAKTSSEHSIMETGFAIQVASLKNHAKAKSLMNKFKEKGYPAFCQSSELNGEMWHRVRIGPYPDRALAEKDRLRLKEAGVDTIVLALDR